MEDKNQHAFLVKGFREIVLICPENNALYINEVFFTFRDLNRIVEAIYASIPTDKVYTNIGIYCNNDVYTYASILAINLYGAAYVPLNTKFPISKNKVIVNICGLDLILSSNNNNHLSEIADQVTVLNTSLVKIDLSKNLESKTNWQQVIQPNSYILFTSGSTGEPKGVAISHSNTHAFFNYVLKKYNFDATDKFLQSSELTFDFSVFAFFIPMHIGACSYVVPNAGIKFVKILQMLKDFKITVLSMVPTILKYADHYLSEINLPDLKYSFFSGDALTTELASKWKKVVGDGNVYNCYGTTESTVFCTDYLFEPSRSKSVNGLVSIGKPFEEMDILIVDELNEPIEKGELCLSGPQVISEYLNGKDRNRFFDRAGKHYYKPGDIVSRDINNDLIFYGRSDTQVKIKGFRVELLEIEYAIEKIAKCKCVVICSKDNKQLNTLFAYIENVKLDIDVLKQELLLLFPDFMIPHKFILVEKFDLSINGKMDKNKLINLE